MELTAKSKLFGPQEVKEMYKEFANCKMDLKLLQLGQAVFPGSNVERMKEQLRELYH
jgi:hypothetical protein